MSEEKYQLLLRTSNAGPLPVTAESGSYYFIKQTTGSKTYFQKEMTALYTQMSGFF